MGADIGERLRRAGTGQGEAWRPRFFRLTRAADREALEALIDGGGRVEVYDALEDQLVDLVKTRNPHLRLSEGAARELVAEHLGGSPPHEYGVWVYYPWSGRLVHLLDEAEFVELRTNRNKYKLTPAEQRRLADKKVGVVGLSVGQVVALTMALERSLGEIRLADFDRLDLSNLNRIRSGVHNLGVSKVLITAREIAEIDPFLKVVVYPVGIHDENINAFLLQGGRLDVVIDECDSIDIKLKLRICARMHRIPVVMETSDRSLIDVERFDLEPARPIFHGLVGGIEPERLVNLSNEEKIPYVLKIIGEETMSSRMVSSMIEIESSIKTWPQLGSCVVYGGGATADVVRRINLGQTRRSGRFIADIEEVVPNDPDQAEDVALSERPPPLSVDAMRRAAAAVDGGAPAPLPWGRELAQTLVELASQAPSGGNTQPWRWLLRGGRLFLFHERSRSECLADFRGLGGVVALGAAVENLRLAAHARGFELSIAGFPCEAEPDLAAVVERAASPREGRWREDLARWIGERHTNRKNAARQPLGDEVYAALREAAGSFAGAELRLVRDDPGLTAIGELIGAGDRLRLTSSRLNREMFGEVRWTAAEAAATGDGLFIDALELSPSDRAGLTMCRRHGALAFLRGLGGGKGLGKMAAKSIASASAVGLLTVPGATARDFFRGGRAMQRMWLVAHSLGVAVYPMTTLAYMFTRLLRGRGEGLEEATVAELQQLRPSYARLFGLGEGADPGEVLLFRLSRAPSPSLKALRRSVGDVLTIAD